MCSSDLLAAATGAAFVREIFTGTYASDMGPWTPDAGAAMRYRDRLHRKDLAMLYNVSAEFADSLDRRSLPDRARSAVFSSIPDAILVSGAITGEAAAMSDLEAVKKVLPDTPVLANTGVKHATIADVLRVADGCIVGSSLKVDGHTWNAVDADRAVGIDHGRTDLAAGGDRHTRAGVHRAAQVLGRLGDGGARRARGEQQFRNLRAHRVVLVRRQREIGRAHV